MSKIDEIGREAENNDNDGVSNTISNSNEETTFRVSCLPEMMFETQSHTCNEDRPSTPDVVSEPSVDDIGGLQELRTGTISFNTRHNKEEPADSEKKSETTKSEKNYREMDLEKSSSNESAGSFAADGGKKRCNSDVDYSDALEKQDVADAVVNPNYPDMDFLDVSGDNLSNPSNESECLVTDFVDAEDADLSSLNPRDAASEYPHPDVVADFSALDISDDVAMMTVGVSMTEGAFGPSIAKDDEADDAEEDDEQLETTTVIDAWSPLLEIRNRELGYSRRQNGSLSFTCRAGGSVRLAEKLKLYASLKNHSGCVNALHFNDSGTLLASGSDDLSIVIWNWVESKMYFAFDSGHRSNVFQCKFMPYTGDCHLVSCARDGQVRLAELSSTGACRVTKKLAHHRGAAHKLALLSGSSHVFYSCGEDAVAFEIDLRQDKPNKLFTTKEKNCKIELYSIHSNPLKPNEFCVGGREHYVRIYDTRKINENENGGILKKFCPPHLFGTENKANITCALYNFDGTEIIASYNDDDIYLFDSTQNDGFNHYIQKYSGHRNSATVKGVNFYGPKSEFIVSGSDCGNVFVWERKSGKIVNYFAADEGGVVNVLEPHPFFPFLATSGLDHDVKVWLPLATEPADLTGLAKVVKKNKKNRESDRTESSDLDSHVMWLLMHHLRRSSRRQTRHMRRDDEDEDDEPGSSSSQDSDDNEDVDEDDEDADEQEGGPNRCAQS